MKHPDELDLHDHDLLLIVTLEQQVEDLEQKVLTLTYDLEHAQDLQAECECELAEVNFRMSGLEK